MDVPEGFVQYGSQGPSLEHVGPIYVLGRGEELTVEGREIARARAIWIVAG